MTVSSKRKFELPEILYSYWEKIPIIQDMSSKVIDKLSKNKVHGFVLLSLSKGIDDQIRGSIKKRHALSALEIKLIMSESYKFEINKSNLYYHIQKFIELGIIKIITTVQKSNIVTSYYGRTSKLIFSGDNSEEKELKKDKSYKKPGTHSTLNNLISSDQFIELLQNFNQNESEINETKALMNKVKEISSNYHREFMHWMIENEENFRGLELNLLDFNFLYNQIRIYNNDMIAMLKKLESVFKISKD